MFRSQAKAVIPLFFFALLFSSCGTTRVLGLRKQEAAGLLRTGNLEFIARAELPADFSGAVYRLGELASIHPAASYYAGRMAGAQREAADQGRRLEFLLFSAALESPSPPARQEAALRLLPLILEGWETRNIEDILEFLTAADKSERPDVVLLRAASLYRLGRYSEAAELLASNPVSGDGWGRAVALFSAWKSYAWKSYEKESLPDEEARREITAFLFDIPPGELRHWAYTEALSIDGLLSPGERGVIVSRRFPESHAITLNNLRPALLDGGVLFFRHPDLMVDLARAYQFTPAMREEGVNLFAAWDRFLETGGGLEQHQELSAFVRSIDAADINARRYRILQHAGRIERARGRFAESSEYFERALSLAPNAIQRDVCLWYILTNALDDDPSYTAADVFLSVMPHWSNMSAFNGVLDRLASRLVLQRQWETLLEIFTALEDIAVQSSRAGTSLAQYAWIVGRVVQEGFLETSRSAGDFFRIAFEQPNGAVYYRTMAAIQLGERFSPTGNARRSRRTQTVPVHEGSELEFLLGFFEHGAASFALPYIRSWESELSIPELRRVSQTLAQAGNWPESIRVVFRYRQRGDYETGRAGFYLSHPRPYLELIERHARRNGFRPELLFGLIRTESLFASAVVSHAGAVGLAQLMPATAQDVAIRVVRAGGPDFRNPAGVNTTDPETNVHLGSFYLRHLIDSQMEGSPILALKAYNGGQGRVRRWLTEDREHPDGGLPKDLFLETIPIAETRHFGRLVLSAAAIYGYLYYRMSMEEVMAGAFR
ncbi:MAG: lytic transglycosylase domain-containing protein [Treponema sp.]|nr:lytic transglycosylase domain-containing protein [Treponema sp.]